MIGTELKGEMLRFLYLTTSMSSTILLYNRTILRQHLEKSDTRFFPTFNLRQMKAAEVVSGNVLSMQFLSTATVDDVVLELDAFAAKYQKWIKDQNNAVSEAKESLREIARSNIQKCQDACNRIDYAIRLLKESAEGDRKAFRAFQLANETMLLQRRQTLLKSGKTFDPAKVCWYPFQLAFVLHELTSFIEPKGHPGQEVPDRQMVDLLWFPTGGGKTEAYLGITAFVIFLRRLRDANADVRFSTISGFKGLESKIVIMIDIDHFSDEETRLLNYVAASRACAMLYVLYDCNAEQERQNMILSGFTQVDT